MAAIPRARLALIGGSGTFALDFPGALADSGVRVLARDLLFSTPFGDAPPMRHVALENGETFLTCRMHGWRPGVTRRAASQQIFWVFREAGVERIVAEGGVGAIDPELAPGDLVVPDDYLDWSLRRDVSLTDDWLLVMRDPLCRKLRELLAQRAGSRPLRGRVRDGGIYAVTDGRHFESRAEVRALAGQGAQVVGQSLAPEIYLAREIGACYAGIHQVVNRAEGVGEDWEHDELREIFHGRAEFMGRLLLDVLRRIPRDNSCSCASLRKPTLIRHDPRR